jgi:hypothetical protein
MSESPSPSKSLLSQPHEIQFAPPRQLLFCSIYEYVRFHVCMWCCLQSLQEDEAKGLLGQYLGWPRGDFGNLLAPPRSSSNLTGPQTLCLSPGLPTSPPEAATAQGLAQSMSSLEERDAVADRVYKVKLIADSRALPLPLHSSVRRVPVLPKPQCVLLRNLGYPFETSVQTPLGQQNFRVH